MLLVVVLVVLSPTPVKVMVARYSITSAVPPLMCTGRPLSSCKQRRCEGECLALPGSRLSSTSGWRSAMGWRSVWHPDLPQISQGAGGASTHRCRGASPGTASPVHPDVPAAPAWGGWGLQGARVSRPDAVLVRQRKVKISIKHLKVLLEFLTETEQKS